MARLKNFLLELFSVLSRLINVLRGGTADMTFSASSHVEGLWTERVIDFVARQVFGEQDHCRIWWEWEVERSRQNVRTAETLSQNERNDQVSAKGNGAETVAEFLIVMIAGLGLSMELPVFIAGVLLASAGSVLTRLFTNPPNRRTLAVTLMAGNFVGLMAAVANQHWMALPPQLAFGAGGFVSVLILPWVLKRLPGLADFALDRVLPDEEKKR